MTEPPVTVTVAVPVQVKLGSGEVAQRLAGDRDRVDAVGQVERRAGVDRDDGVRNSVQLVGRYWGPGSRSRSGRRRR